TGISLNAAAILLSGFTYDEYNGAGASVIAGKQAEADFTVDNSINFTTPGTFTAKGENLTITGASRLALDLVTRATGAGAKANVSVNGSTNITAKSIAITTSGSMSIVGGVRAGSYSAEAGVAVTATQGGNASEKVMADVNLTATGGALTLSGEGIS